MNRPFLLPMLWATALIVVIGCSALSNAFQRSITPRPDTGEVPAYEIGKSIPTVVGNPADVRAWADIVENILIITGVLGAGTAVGVGGVAMKRKFSGSKDGV